MIIRHIAVSALIFCMLTLEVIANEKVAFSFETDPKVTCTEEKGSGEQKNMFRTFRLSLPPTEGKSFSLEFKLNILRFHHYGKLMVGLSNDKGQEIDLLFNLDDGRIRRCFPRVRIAKGLDIRIKPFEAVEQGEYVVAIDYLHAEQNVLIALRDSTGKELFSTGKIRATGKLNLNTFYASVMDSGEGVSEISYSPAEKLILWRSYVGVEGEYPYVIEGTLDDIIFEVE